MTFTDPIEGSELPKRLSLTSTDLVCIQRVKVRSRASRRGRPGVSGGLDLGGPPAARRAIRPGACRIGPRVVLGDMLEQTGGVYETTTRLTPKLREDIREIAELTSDDQLLAVSELPEVPVSLEHLRHVDPQTPHSRRLSARCHSGRESTAAPQASTSA